MTRALIPLRAIYRRLEESGRPELPLLSVYRELGVIPREGREDNFNKASDDLTNYKVVRPGDLVLNKMKTWQGSLGVSSYEGIVSPAYFVGRKIADVDDRFMHHLLRSAPLIAEYGARSKGIRPSQWDLPWDEFASIKVRIPDISVQRAIAGYLDLETARIDALIEKKQRMVELVELRQTLFTQKLLAAGNAITGKSIEDASSVLTGTDLRWVRARFLCDIDTGASDTEDSDEEGLYPFFVRSQTPQRSSRYLFDGEAVLTAGDGAGVGKVFHHFNGRFDAHQRVYVLRNFREVSGKYFFHCFKALFAESALDGSAKSTVDSVRRHMISEMRIPVPSLDKQLEIVGRLERAGDVTISLTSKLESQVLLLKARRQALITAAVTGELEIKGAAA